MPEYDKTISLLKNEYPKIIIKSILGLQRGKQLQH